MQHSRMAATAPRRAGACAVGGCRMPSSMCRLGCHSTVARTSSVDACGKRQVHRRRCVGRVRVAEEVGVETNGATPGLTPPTNMLDFNELSELIRMVHATDIVELELKAKAFSLSVKKKGAMLPPSHGPMESHFQGQSMMQPQSPPLSSSRPAFPPPPRMTPAAMPSPSPASAPPAADGAGSSEGIESTSPMAGTFYRSPAPGESAFVQEGDKVKRGQTVCIIEAMKLMNEIEAEADGIVVRFLVENGSSVTPGQSLLVIKP